MPSSNCCFLTCIQISQEAGHLAWYSHLFQNFPQLVVIHTVKGFDIVNKAEVDLFLEFSCFFYDPMDVGNLNSVSSALSKSSLNIWRFTVHLLLKPHLENFEHYFTSVWDECNCVIVWTFFAIALLWDWNENWPFLCVCITVLFKHLFSLSVTILNSHSNTQREILHLFQIRKLRTSLTQTQELCCRDFQKLFLAAPRAFVISFLLLICVLDQLFSTWVLWHTRRVPQAIGY